MADKKVTSVKDLSADDVSGDEVLANTLILLDSAIKKLDHFPNNVGLNPAQIVSILKPMDSLACFLDAWCLNPYEMACVNRIKNTITAECEHIEGYYNLSSAEKPPKSLIVVSPESSTDSLGLPALSAKQEADAKVAYDKAMKMKDELLKADPNDKDALSIDQRVTRFSLVANDLSGVLIPALIGKTVSENHGDGLIVGVDSVLAAVLRVLPANHPKRARLLAYEQARRDDLGIKLSAADALAGKTILSKKPEAKAPEQPKIDQTIFNVAHDVRIRLQDLHVADSDNLTADQVESLVAIFGNAALSVRHMLNDTHPCRKIINDAISALDAYELSKAKNNGMA